MTTTSRDIALPLVAAAILLALFGPTTHGLGADQSQVCRVRTVSDASLSGRFVAFDPTQGLTLAGTDGTEQRIPARDVVEIRLPTKIEPPPPGLPTWHLDGGDVLVARITAGNERRVRLERDDLGAFDVPLTRLRAVLLPDMKPDTPSRMQPRSTRPTATDHALEDDLIVLANGDRITGLIAQIEPTGVTMETDRARTTLGFDVLQEVRLARVAPVAKEPPPTGPLRARLHLADRSHLTVAGFEFGSTKGTVTLAQGLEQEPREIALERIRRIDVLGGRWQWLDQLAPVEARHTPLFDIAWPHQVNRNVHGGPLRIGNRRFEHGLGVFPRSRLVYKLSGGCERFVARYGLDAPPGSLAAIVVRVVVDGKEVYRDDRVRPDGKVRDLSIDIAGKSKLELMVDFGKNGPVQDRFNWVDAALIRK